MAAQDVYQKLQRHLDKMPVGFPATESGVEIRILKHLFNPEEAEIALNLSALSEPLERIHRRVKGSGISIEKLEQVLDRLVEKGAIMGGKMLSGKTNGKYYSKAQLAIGMFEFQVDRITGNLLKIFSNTWTRDLPRNFIARKHRRCAPYQ